MNKQNRLYLLVGLFVVIATTILFFVWLWFLSSDRQSYNTYLAIFTEPVDGITNNSVIKYNGVEVGKVKLIKLDNNNPHNILVYLNILQTIPINKDTYATMKPQGITGLSFINLYLPPNSTTKENIIPHNSEPYPQIPTKQSFLSSLLEQAQSITSNIKDISVQFKSLLNHQNLSHVSKILSNFDQVTTAVAKRSNDISTGIKALSQVIVDIKENFQMLNNTVKDIDSLTLSLTTTSKNTNNLVNNFQQNTLQNFNTTIMPSLNHTLERMDQSSSQLEQLLILLNQNPSVLIRGIANPKPGPGENIREEN